MKLLVILLCCIGGLFIYTARKEDDRLTQEYIKHGDGVLYTDPRPLNNGGTFARGPETQWESQEKSNKTSYAVGALCLVLAAYLWFHTASKHKT